MTATRDPWLDNAKMGLVTLVVIGHAWTLLPQTTLNNHVYDFLYAWHVPAFVFVTGYDHSVIPDKFASTPRFSKPADLREVVRAVAALG